jgi:hypothetical protein
MFQIRQKARSERQSTLFEISRHKAFIIHRARQLCNQAFIIVKENHEDTLYFVRRFEKSRWIQL